MKKRGYKFTKRKHSQYAIFACGIGAIALISEIVALYGSFMANGSISPKYGYIYLFALLFAVCGIAMGGWSLYGQRYYRTFGVLALVINIVVMIVFGIVVF